MTSEIKISNASNKVTYIDIEGVIGVPEQWQFDEPGAKIATYERFKERITAIGNIKSDKIVVNIRSTGGNVNDALLIHDALVASSARITTRCYGYVASAATIIAQAASIGCREMSSNSLYLIHKSIGAVEGNTNEMSQTVDLLSKTDQRIANIYAERSGKPIECFAEIMAINNGNGMWLSPQEALNAGLVDKIIEAKPISNNVTKLIGELGLPEIPKHYRSGKLKNIAEKWNAILEILGINKAEYDVDREEIDGAKERFIEEAIAEKVAAQVSNVALPENRIKEHESLQIRLNAKATETKPVDDASVSDVRMSQNEAAYVADIQRFK